MSFRFYAFWLCGVCILLFGLQLLVSGFETSLILNSSAWSEPWRFLTAIFLHGSVTHLLYNLFALALFGSILERLIGGRGFLLTFFLTGIGANLVSVLFYPSSLGASGAIFGVIGALIVVRPLLTVFAFGLPMPIFVAGLIWAAGDVIGIFIPSNVANIAHLSGLAFGLILGVFYRKPTLRSHNKITLDERYVNQWEDAYLR